MFVQHLNSYCNTINETAMIIEWISEFTKLQQIFSYNALISMRRKCLFVSSSTNHKLLQTYNDLEKLSNIIYKM